MANGSESGANGPKARRRFYALGIGASAGGVAALRTFLEGVPPSPGLAIVIVVHLPADRESRLDALLQPYTPLPVAQVTRTTELEPNRVYIIPPNANLEAVDTHLRLSPLEHRRVERAPIDHFLRSLAATQDGLAVGVILTGAGSDGEWGIRWIKECGGLTVAQDPDEAEFDSMPRSAIATGLIDWVLPVREMGARIVAYCENRRATPEPSRMGTPAAEDSALERIIREVRARTGAYVAMFARDVVLRCVVHRMQLNRAGTLDDYRALLEQHGDEARELLRDLVASAPAFLDVPVRATLQESVLPGIFARKTSAHDKIRVWSIGSGLGEEAYSIAIELHAHCARTGSHPRLQVFATALEESALTRARDGSYPEAIAASVPEEHLRSYFGHEHGRYTVRPEVRGTVIFSRHDLLEDPPYSHLDLIVCRTLLHKLLPDVRRDLLSMFHYALEPQGVLIVGPHDAIEHEELFVAADAATGVYRRAAGARALLAWPARGTHGGTAPLDTTRRADRPHDRVVLHRIAIEPYVPPSALVDRDGQALYYSARASDYLQIPGGELTHELSRLAREPLGTRLASALPEVARSGVPWSSAPLTVVTDHGPRRVVMRVEPLRGQGEAGIFLVVFDELRSPEPTNDSTEIEIATSIAKLETELASARRQLRAMCDERADEHSSVASRELPDLLAQLDGSKEELQTLNEELTTLDEENRRRLGALRELSAELQHLLESTGVATIFLNRNLELRKFTPPAAELFHVLPSDIGRPLNDLSHELEYPELMDDIARVLNHVAPSHREAQARDGRWFLLRILPYRANETVDGVVLSLLDISERKRSELKLLESDRRKDEFLAVLAHELRNPLAPISAGVEVLRRMAHEPRIVEQIAQTISRQTKQLVRLVDDLLELSRVTGGRLRLRRAIVPLSDVIRDAVAAVRPIIDAEGHELTITSRDETLAVDGDPTRLTQIVANLLANAARYTPRGGRIAISANLEENDAVIRVRDTGVGIEKGQLPRVFEMFYQGDNPRTNAGLGIGLTLAKSLVEMHGGTIAVSSAGKNEGSEFTIRLPASQRETANEPSRSVDPNGLSGHRVLIVDDNVDAAETLRMLVGSLGDNDVHTAPNGEDGLTKAARLHPDVVLLDLKMPGIDGFEVARRIRREPWGSDVMLVALTGWAQEEHKQRTREAGFNGHLTKPAGRDALESLLREQSARAAAQGA
jgi:two-component system CheB/CheR fusion protein